MIHFADRLLAAVRRTRNAVLVGVDPQPNHLPPGFLARFPSTRAGVALALKEFGYAIVNVVAPLVPAVKFQSAYYEAYGPEGLQALFDSVRYAQERGLLAIVDGKRNDIGSTAEAYARAYLGRISIGDRMEACWDADAITVNAYLGSDGVRPFIAQAELEGKGVFVLVRTSNPSAGEFQDLVSEGRPLYRHVAQRLAEWAGAGRGQSGYSFVGAVVGATYPEQLAELRQALPGVIFLVPGYGAQGGTARDVAPAFDADGRGALINSSRGVAFAYEREDLRTMYGDDWQKAVAHAVCEMIDDLARHTAAGRLREHPLV
jgi:orotidine-5'-phosphate decarboxylase